MLFLCPKVRNPSTFFRIEVPGFLGQAKSKGNASPLEIFRGGVRSRDTKLEKNSKRWLVLLPPLPKTSKGETFSLLLACPKNPSTSIRKKVLGFLTFGHKNSTPFAQNPSSVSSSSDARVCSATLALLYPSATSCDFRSPDSSRVSGATPTRHLPRGLDCSST